MNKQEYETPITEVIVFEGTDIITGSNDTDWEYDDE